MSRRRCAVLGSPIAHSLSPVLHRAAYAELGLDWEYAAVEVTSAGLAGFLDRLDDSWRGLSLTMPLKRTVLPLADSADGWAVMSGAANTLVLGTGRAAYNTDVPGAVEALRERLTESVDRAVVLGGGATAASVLLALAELGCRSATLLVREPARAEETVTVVRQHPHAPEVVVQRLGSDVDPMPADLLVSTVPVAAQSEALLAALCEIPAVFDVVYDPWPTPLARAASDSGRTLVSGLDLLAHQAVLQVELMTGAAAPVQVLRAAGEDELDRRALHKSSDNARPTG